MQVLCRFTVRIDPVVQLNISTLLFHTCRRCAHHKRNWDSVGHFIHMGHSTGGFQLVRVVALHMNVVVDQTASSVDSFTNQRYLWKK